MGLAQSVSGVSGILIRVEKISKEKSREWLNNLPEKYKEVSGKPDTPDIPDTNRCTARLLL